MSLASVRLLHAQGDYAPSEEVSQPSDTNLDLRIVAIFAILVAGFLGSLLPQVVKCFRNPAHPATLLLRALSAGVILALAIIHVIPDGIADLEEVHDFPFGALCVVFGCLIMVSTESASRAFLHRRVKQPDADAAPTLNPAHPEGPCHEAGDDTAISTGHGRHSMRSPHKHGHVHTDKPGAGAGTSAQDTHADHHSHTCLAVNNAASWAANPQAADVHNQVIAYMFELACVVHSALIGVALGVTVGARQRVIALLVALVFHQGLEGIGLGSTIVRAKFPWWKGLVMTTTYALMTPMGVGIGIAVADTYDPESVVALSVQGTLNSVSGGLLLYISLVQLIAEDFTRGDLPSLGTGLQILMHVALLFGTACMAVIAIWA